MDNGDEIPCLNDEWTFLGAQIGEWGAGFGAAMIFFQVFFAKAVYGVLVMVLIVVFVAVALSTLRKRFLDEHRGVKNYLCLSLGFAPPGIPTPAALQKNWSGFPIKDLNQRSNFIALGINDLFPSATIDQEDEGNNASWIN